MNDANHHLIVCETDITSWHPAYVIIPNLTRNVRPYAFVEKCGNTWGVSKERLCYRLPKFCQEIAEENNCYKMMLLTGSKEESTLNFFIEMPVITVQTRLHLYSGLIYEICIHLNHWGRK